MRELSGGRETIRGVLAVPLLQLGGSPFNLWTLVCIVILGVLLFHLTGTPVEPPFHDGRTAAVGRSPFSLARLV